MIQNTINANMLHFFFGVVLVNLLLTYIIVKKNCSFNGHTTQLKEVLNQIK